MIPVACSGKLARYPATEMAAAAEEATVVKRQAGSSLIQGHMQNYHRQGVDQYPSGLQAPQQQVVYSMQVQYSNAAFHPLPPPPSPPPPPPPAGAPVAASDADLSLPVAFLLLLQLGTQLGDQRQGGHQEDFKPL
jgi:hypothetical protein